ncbi:MAG: HPr family phosphocarrier protein [Spirochaetaceae bacterium]|nr:HPr family phosphocarrier protein [Spirochaetaceae bacterium]
MVERVVKIINRAGIHARPASAIVQKTKNFKASVYFEDGSRKIDAKSILSIITLGAAYGKEIKITAEGEDEQYALDTIAHLFETKFEEE